MDLCTLAPGEVNKEDRLGRAGVEELWVHGGGRREDKQYCKEGT